MIQTESPVLHDQSAAPITEALARLDDLLALDDFDEEFERPSPYAVATARSLVSGALPLAPEAHHLLPAFSTAGDGGVYFRWIANGREIRVLAPPDAGIPTRLYHWEGGRDGAESYLTAAMLAVRLQWLVNG